MNAAIKATALMVVLKPESLCGGGLHRKPSARGSSAGNRDGWMAVRKTAASVSSVVERRGGRCRMCAV
jgi:hypothetical protein